MNNAFEISGLVKEYSGFRLGEMNLELPSGTVMAYIGNNGAGKTTTILMLAGLLRQDSGEINILGEPVNIKNGDWKNDIGYVGDSGGFYESWNAEKNLRFISQFYKNWSEDYKNSLIKRLDMQLDKDVRKLSTGNRMKLKIIAALSHKPKLLLLDKPASGLDPVAREEFTDILFEFMQDESNSIFYSTHIISEISRLADNYTFLTDGMIVHQDNKEDLLAKWSSIFVKSNIDSLSIPALEKFETENGRSKIISFDSKTTLEYLNNTGAEIEEILPLSIEEISINILRRKLR
jgi:ABC-2 type transport system ATP-binding protein